MLASSAAASAASSSAFEIGRSSLEEPFRGREPDRLVGGGAETMRTSSPSTTTAIPTAGQSSAERVRALEIRGTGFPHPGNRHLRDQLVAGKRVLQIARIERLHGDGALPARARDGWTRESRAARSGGKSMCGSACASAPPTVATLRTRTLESVRKRARDRGHPAFTGAARSSARRLAIAPTRKLAVDADLVQPELSQADEAGGPQHAALHHQHERGAAGKRARVLDAEQRDGFGSEAGSASSKGLMRGCSFSAAFQLGGDLVGFLERRQVARVLQHRQGRAVDAVVQRLGHLNGVA
jgi:hypothetical protein